MVPTSLMSVNYVGGPSGKESLNSEGILIFCLPLSGATVLFSYSCLVERIEIDVITNTVICVISLLVYNSKVK